MTNIYHIVTERAAKASGFTALMTDVAGYGHSRTRLRTFLCAGWSPFFSQALSASFFIIYFRVNCSLDIKTLMVDNLLRFWGPRTSARIFRIHPPETLWITNRLHGSTTAAGIQGRRFGFCQNERIPTLAGEGEYAPQPGRGEGRRGCLRQSHRRWCCVNAWMLLDLPTVVLRPISNSDIYRWCRPTTLCLFYGRCVYGEGLEWQQFEAASFDTVQHNILRYDLSLKYPWAKIFFILPFYSCRARICMHVLMNENCLK